MNILDIIIHHKEKEIVTNKAKLSLKDLEKTIDFDRKSISLKESILNPEKKGIIAEFKRKSPSKGFIKENANVLEITQGYQNAGASAVSILTDSEFFGGSDADLIGARPVLQIPILRKEFIIDEYQILEAKKMGADVILLISACLTGERLKTLAKFAKNIGLEVLMEIHNETELNETLNEYVDLVGVNNRDLRTFTVSIQTSLDLVEKIPNEFVKISESGLSEASSILTLHNAGFQGFLIGENFMKEENPAKELENFIKQIKC